MKKEQIALLKESYLKEATRPDGRKSTLGEYIKFCLDGGIDFVTSKDLVVFDDANEMLHCVCMNEDMRSQSDFPIKVISSAYEIVQQMETVMSSKNFEEFLNTGFLAGTISDDKKNFMLEWAKTINNQALQPMDAEPAWDNDVKIIPKAASKIEKENYVPLPLEFSVNGNIAGRAGGLDQIVEMTGDVKVTLKDSITVPERLKVNNADSNIIIDLNGKTITFNHEENRGLAVKNGSLTLMNGTIYAKADCVGLTCYPEDSATLTLKNMTIKSEDACAAVVYGPGTVNVIDCDMASDSKQFATFSGIGDADSAGTVVNLTNSVFTNSKREAIYFPQGGTLNIENCNIVGVNGLYTRSGNTTVSGSSTIIRATGPKNEYVFVNADASPTGDAIVVDSCGYPGGEPTITILGGSVMSTHADALACYNKEGELPDNAATLVNIEHGAFNQDINEVFLKEGSSKRMINNGMWIVDKDA